MTDRLGEAVVSRVANSAARQERASRFSGEADGDLSRAIPANKGSGSGVAGCSDR